MTLGATGLWWSRHAVRDAFSFDVDVKGGLGVRRFVWSRMDVVGHVPQGDDRRNELSAEALLLLPGLWCLEIWPGDGEYYRNGLLSVMGFRREPTWENNVKTGASIAPICCLATERLP